MPNNYLSVLYQHIIQVENKNVGLKVEGHKHTIAPPPQSKKWGAHAPLPPPPPLPTPVYIYMHVFEHAHSSCVCVCVFVYKCMNV